jgi:hydrophobe/amphiphile efflux-1 (HAE1) family protein
MFQKVPGGFIPTMDQGYLIVFAQLPDGASLQRSDDVQRQIAEIGQNTPGVKHTFAIEGLSILDSTTKSNALTFFFPLKDFSERIGHPKQSATAIVAKLQTAFSSIQDAFVIAIQPPSVRGMGNAGGFQLEIEDRRNAGFNALQQATDAVTAAANAEPGLSGVFTTYRSQVPQLFLNIDREKVQTLNVPISSVFTTFQSYLGTNYVNDFNFLGRTYQVNLQGDAAFRSDPNQILKMYTRNSTGGMVPLGSLMNVQRINGPDTVGHYNVYPAALIQGATLPGVSSGQAIEKMERICRENLPSQFSFEWTQLTYQGIAAGNTAILIFPLCVLFVFLALAAQYESWSLPVAVILIVPMCLLSAMVGVYFRGQDNNIFTQIGFIVLVGLACKNAILIVEFARQQMLSGKGRMEAAAEASRLRLRPILMTSFAFILGVLPLVIAKGRGGRNGSGVGHSRLCWNDRGDFFWNLSYPSVFLCDHEDFCPSAQEEVVKLNRASRTQGKSSSLSRRDAVDSSVTGRYRIRRLSGRRTKNRSNIAPTRRSPIGSKRRERTVELMITATRTKNDRPSRY